MTHQKPTLGKCAWCGGDIVYTQGRWTHADGRGFYCRPSDQPTTTGTYLDSPGMREAHLRSARGEW
jgi:hypothetical protein